MFSIELIMGVDGYSVVIQDLLAIPVTAAIDGLDDGRLPFSSLIHLLEDILA
jgi:hypothetical protein